jgi:hypothetical protein
LFEAAISHIAQKPNFVPGTELTGFKQYCLSYACSIASGLPKNNNRRARQIAAEPFVAFGTNIESGRCWALTFTGAFK